MTTIEAVILGTVQGLTEFLPVSSSGHLVLVRAFFGFSEPDIFFDICLHAGTLMAVVLYFRKDIFSLIKGKNINWFIFLIIGTIPAVLAGILYGKQISGFFEKPGKAAFMLLITALVLFIGHLNLRTRTRPRKELTFLASVAVGLAQACALFPGISRSGMTISAGIVGGIKMEDAYKFSFLLSIPVIAGALLYKTLQVDAVYILSNNLMAYISGIISAFVVGFLSLALLWKVIRGKRLFIFGIYCLVLGAAGIIVL